MTKLLKSYENAYDDISAAIVRLEQQVKNKKLTAAELVSAHARIDILRSERAEIGSIIKDIYRYLAPKPETPSRAALEMSGVRS